MMRRSDLLLLLLSFVALLPWMGTRDYWSRAEGRPPLVARDILLTGRLQPPYLGGEAYLNKPPLYHASVAAVFHALGESPFAARLPSLLCAVLIILLCARMARHWGSESAGFYAGACLLLSVRFWTQARSSEMETMLTLGVTLCIFGITTARNTRSKAVAIFLGTALATLTKGPVLALLFPALFLGVQAGMERSLVPLKRPILLLAPLAAALATAAYYGPMLLDPAIKPLLLERASMANVEHIRGPFYYLPLLLLCMLPGLLLPALAASRQSQQPLAVGVRHHLAFALVGVLVLSLSKSKQSHYLLPVLPHFAIAFGALVARGEVLIVRRAWPVSLLFALATAGLVVAHGMGHLPMQRTLLLLAGFLAVMWAALAWIGRPGVLQSEPPRAARPVGLLIALLSLTLLVFEVTYSDAKDSDNGFRDAAESLRPSFAGHPVASIDFHPAVLYSLPHDTRLVPTLEAAQQFVATHPDGRILMEWDEKDPPNLQSHGLRSIANFRSGNGKEGWAVLARSADTLYDVVVYGDTPAAITAALEAADASHSVLLLLPTKHLGGLSTSGLGATDIGNKAAIGGRSRAFYQAIKAHYARPDAWIHQSRDSFRGYVEDQDAMWFFEPHVARAVFDAWLRESRVHVREEAPLDRERPVRTEDSTKRITEITLKSGEQIRGRIFIDATYEGDLLARALVPYTVGREANTTYGETLNGVQTARARHHQFQHPVSPYRIAKDQSSGLLPGIHAEGPGSEGSGDRLLQAYNFRLCLTDNPKNRVPFRKPSNYLESDFELLLRHYDAGDAMTPWHGIPMPNRKTDTNNNGAFSTDFIGANWGYPEASDEERARMRIAHREYTEGLLWTLAHHPRVPESVREEVGRFGLSRDEFADNDHWPYQLYVREARRMIADVVMTERHCLGQEVVTDPIGLAAYNMDSHHVQRYVDDQGHVRNEGDIQVAPRTPYGISYRAIIPPRGSITNLLVPCCLSASHIAYGSIRMEPVFMILGQSAGAAAALSLQKGLAVQDLPYEDLRDHLRSKGQVLAWPGPQAHRNAVAAATLPGIVFDDEQATFSGDWWPSQSITPHLALGYRHDGNQSKGHAAATFHASGLTPGSYEVRLATTPGANRASNTPVRVTSKDGTIEISVDQRPTPPINSLWISLGTYEFLDTAVITISNEGTDGHVIVDGVQLLPVRK
ncbi:MAG TPA: FAD-dependent oxidoreductase [Planctomycetota bacterium]|nr:FAD-dependent oxidoreductase [Planctomycetota bacterium]